MNETSNALYIKFENHKIPEFKEVKNKEYIYFGENNDYPDYLIELYLRCSKHNAIINGKANYIYGKGLGIDESNSSIEQKAISQKFIENFNPFIHDMIKDFEIFNSIAIEIIYNKAGTDIAEYAYMPISKIRTNAEEDMYFYSNNWKERNQSEEKTGYKEFQPFDYENKIKGSQLFVYKLKSPKNGVDKNVYGIPSYIGATAAIETDIEISNFHLNNIKSGFSMGTIINFNNGVPPTEDAQKEIEKQIKKKATGTDKAGGLVITFNKSAENAPTITSFVPNELDKQFIEIGKRISQEIFTAHNIISPVLFGVVTESALGQRNEMLIASELLQSTNIDIRQTILENIINQFASLAGIVNKFKFIKLNSIKSGLPDDIIKKAYDSLTIDELREIVGLPKVKKQLFIDQGKKNIDLEWFSNIGIETEKYEILFERDFEGQSDEDCIIEFSKQQLFAKEITENEKAIIDLLGKDVLTPSDAIANVLNISTKEVNDLINGLIDKGYLTTASEPTKKGDKISEDSKTNGIEVKYRYGWRSGFDNGDKKNSREFCKHLLDQNKLYSRSEIDNLNNEQGLDVWESRGGWWNKGGANLPYCRHIWKQTVVKIK